MGKTGEKQQSNLRHIIMTQMATLLAVATVFIGLWTLMSTFYIRGKGGACMRDKTKNLS